MLIADVKLLQTATIVICCNSTVDKVGFKFSKTFWLCKLFFIKNKKCSISNVIL